MPEVITNSTAGLHTGSGNCEPGSCLSVSECFYPWKAFFQLLNLYSLAFYEYVYVHIVCRQQTHIQYFGTENQKDTASPPVTN